MAALPLIELMPEIAGIRDDALRRQVLEYWETAFDRSTWSSAGGVEAVPYNTQISTSTLVHHSRAVTQLALTGSRNARELHRVELDDDLIIAGAILHDVCKLLESEPDGEGGARKSELGRFLAHGVVGGYLAHELGLPIVIEHIIVTHTPQSKALPQTAEGVLIRHADILDADLLYGGAGLDLFINKGEK